MRLTLRLIPLFTRNGIPVFSDLRSIFYGKCRYLRAVQFALSNGAVHRRQLKECYEFAKRNEYNVIGEYIDRALTGTTDKRPEFLRMIEDSKKKTFKYVLVYQLDRFARNRYDSATYKAKLKKNGVRVLSAKENITEDASGILVEGVLESMAEYYSVELSQR